MSEISSLNKVGGKHSIGRLASKTHVSMEAPKETQAPSENIATQELKKIEFEMEQADHAFALMVEIRQKIEKQYQELTASDRE